MIKKKHPTKEEYYGLEKPCKTKLCRMGGKNCEFYKSCRDTCKLTNKRLTTMLKCPDCE